MSRLIAIFIWRRKEQPRNPLTATALLINVDLSLCPNSTSAYVSLDFNRQYWKSFRTLFCPGLVLYITAVLCSLFCRTWLRYRSRKSGTADSLCMRASNTIHSQQASDWVFLCVITLQYVHWGGVALRYWLHISLYTRILWPFSRRYYFVDWCLIGRIVLKTSDWSITLNVIALCDLYYAGPAVSKITRVKLTENVYGCEILTKQFNFTL